MSCGFSEQDVPEGNKFLHVLGEYDKKKRWNKSFIFSSVVEARGLKRTKSGEPVASLEAKLKSSKTKKKGSRLLDKFRSSSDCSKNVPLVC